MKQVYEAVDKLDGEITYFFFDGVGGYSTLFKSITRSEKNALNYFKKSETGNWVDTGNRRADMINPVLIAEW
jgi:hypothetical protein